MKLGPYLGFDRHHEGEIGLEIETESTTPYGMTDDIVKYWTPQIDGSLRQNGMEYVFSRPYNRDSKEFEGAMASFESLARVTPFIRSAYSSVHVHLNMLGKEVVHVMNFLCLYFIFEEFLTEYCGASRYSNLFCLNTSRAELIYKTAKDMAKAIEEGQGANYIRNLNNGTLKYSGINLVPLRTLGSLEVRTHPGSVDVIAIKRWIDILLKLYHRADTYQNPVEIVNRLHGYKSKAAFAELHFQEFTKFLNLDKIDEKMEDGIWYAASIAGVVNNWKDFGSKKPVKGSRSAKYVELEQWNNTHLTAGQWATMGTTATNNVVPTQIDPIEAFFTTVHPTQDQ